MRYIFHNIAFQTLVQRILLGLFAGHKKALVHIAFNVLGPSFGVRLAFKGFAGGRIAFFADTGFPLIGPRLRKVAMPSPYRLQTLAKHSHFQKENSSKINLSLLLLFDLQDL